MPVAGYGWDDLLWRLGAIQEARYAIAAMYALQLCEWFNCIEKEIRLIYHARWTSIKVSYLLCRYYTLLCWPVIMWGYLGNHAFDTCVKTGHPIHILLTPYQFFAQAVMAMRAYAFTGRDWRVLVALGSCYATLLGINFWAFCTHVDMPPRIFYEFMGDTGCFPNYGADPMAIRIGLSMLAATLMDFISLVAILAYCRKERAVLGNSLADYFIKQGLGAFFFITIINIATAVAFFKPPSYHTGVGLPLSMVVSTLVACRVILHLRRKATPTPTEISRRNSIIVNIALDNVASHDDGDIWLMESEYLARRTLMP